MVKRTNYIENKWTGPPYILTAFLSSWGPAQQQNVWSQLCKAVVASDMLRDLANELVSFLSF